MVAERVVALPYREHAVVASDGVRLAAQSIGAGPAILLANGIGVTRPALDVLVGHLRKRYHVVCWDYRGAGESVIDEPSLEMLSLERHARDGLEVLDALGIEEAIVFGWSMSERSKTAIP